MNTTNSRVQSLMNKVPTSVVDMIVELNKQFELVKVIQKTCGDARQYVSNFFSNAESAPKMLDPDFLYHDESGRDVMLNLFLMSLAENYHTMTVSIGARDINGLGFTLWLSSTTGTAEEIAESVEGLEEQVRDLMMGESVRSFEEIFAKLEEKQNSA